GIQKARFTLAWNDPASGLLATKALVNDLDLSVTRLSDNTRYLPWVLNSFPHADSLRQLPQRKKDTLNNAEQVTINDPLAGAYQLSVNGSAIPAGTQSFFIAWQLDSTNTFEFTHPVKQNVFRGADKNTVRWQHTVSGNGTLQYSYDNANWNTIATNIPLTNGYYSWVTPDTLNTARLRMLTPAGTFVSDSFIIATPFVVATGYNCTDDFLVWWNRQRNTGGYNIFRLGAKYMEPFTFTADTFAFYTKNAQPALHYAVQPVLLNGVPAQRSSAYNYTTQGVGCFFRSLLGELSGNQAILTLELGSVYGLQSITLEKQSGFNFNSIQQAPVNGQLTHLFTDAALKTGLNVYRARIVRTNGQIFYSDLAVVYYFGASPYLVYPNPVHAGSTLNIVASELKNAELHLFNTNGQRVLRFKTRQFSESISTARLQGGVYIYKILESGRVVQQGKLVIY
ncbi:MAG: T9SS type A sorting domain-containing protein, partial [Dinghuibacter sp.]|nr:T9SS type A sorting domain-containing protein [Dinghuibacter sp.]